MSFAIAYKYFKWQKEVGEFGGWAEMTKFLPYIKKGDNIIDFGCGGGYLLKNIVCAEKIGVEVNETAIETATTVNKQKVYKDIDTIQDDWADVIISNHALEHTIQPFETLQILYKKLKKGGTIVFYVPSESFRVKYIENDINNHLYTWSPLNIGNLFKEVGFEIIEVKPFLHKWPPKYQLFAKFGRCFFDFTSTLYGHISTKRCQLRIVATKK